MFRTVFIVGYYLCLGEKIIYIYLLIHAKTFWNNKQEISVINSPCKRLEYLTERSYREMFNIHTFIFLNSDEYEHNTYLNWLFKNNKVWVAGIVRGRVLVRSWVENPALKK